MHRRLLLSSSLLVLASACTPASTPPATTPPTPQQQITGWLKLLAAGAAAMPAILVTIPNMPISVRDQDEAILASVNADANSIIATLTASATQINWVQEIMQVVSDIAPYIPAAAPYAQTIAAVMGLAQVLLAAYGTAATPALGAALRYANGAPPAFRPLPLPQAIAVLNALPQVTP